MAKELANLLGIADFRGRIKMSRHDVCARPILVELTGLNQEEMELLKCQYNVTQSDGHGRVLIPVIIVGNQFCLELN